VRPSVASRLIRGFELLNTLQNNFNGNESEDSAQNAARNSAFKLTAAKQPH
jgi:hypothetical protein|tara:strand:- start:7 stop:159 length:153 start_codon:yes stop_codon:yes gene_type:complete